MMIDLRFYKFLLVSFVFHLLFVLAMAFYSANFFIPIQPIKTKIYFQKSSELKTTLPKSKPVSQRQSSSNNLDSNLNSSLKQLNLSEGENLLQEVQEELDFSQTPSLKNIQLNQNTLPNITSSENKNLVISEENLAADSAHQNSKYRKLIEAIVQNNWKSSFSDKKLQVIIQAKILKTGKLNSLKIMQSSKLLAFDLSAVEAMKSSDPFPAIPDKYGVKEFVFVFRFQGGQILGE